MFLGMSKLINNPYWRFSEFFLKVGFFGHFVTSISPIFHFLTVFAQKVQLCPHNKDCKWLHAESTLIGGNNELKKAAVQQPDVDL